LEFLMGRNRNSTGPTGAELEALAAFRHALRQFLATTERNAERRGVTPQQHQALLSIRSGYPGRSTITVSELANHLLLKHHSAVELAGRMEKAGLIVRMESKTDRRATLLRLTDKAETILMAISRESLQTLDRSAPAIANLMSALGRASASHEHGQ
jgi:DNA-binding MarR family transcriptional regulator